MNSYKLGENDIYPVDVDNNCPIVTLLLSKYILLLIIYKGLVIIVCILHTVNYSISNWSILFVDTVPSAAYIPTVTNMLYFVLVGLPFMVLFGYNQQSSMIQSFLLTVLLNDTFRLSDNCYSASGNLTGLWLAVA